MVKFGKQLLKEAIPEWRDFYVNYRKLKRCIKRQQMEQDAAKVEVFCDQLLRHAAF
jgi:SPX domain protein involved in polyphosphate accumulation